MQKQNMPGHLLAALVVLAVLALSVGWLTLMPLMLVMAALGGHGLVLVPILMLLMFAWFAWLFFGLLTRQAWASAWTTISAAVMCTVGGLGMLVAMLSELWEVLLVDSCLMSLGLGGYLMYAIGRADVREWLTRPASSA